MRSWNLSSLVLREKFLCRDHLKNFLFDFFIRKFTRVWAKFLAKSSRVQSILTTLCSKFRNCGTLKFGSLELFQFYEICRSFLKWITSQDEELLSISCLIANRFSFPPLISVSLCLFLYLFASISNSFALVFHSVSVSRFDSLFLFSFSSLSFCIFLAHYLSPFLYHSLPLCVPYFSLSHSLFSQTTTKHEAFLEPP